MNNQKSGNTSEPRSGGSVSFAPPCTTFQLQLQQPSSSLNLSFQDFESDLLEISVESLVGTVFEMRLSKLETVGNIKARQG